jgi:bacterioferritin-associated ferredoxin
MVVCSCRVITVDKIHSYLKAHHHEKTTVPSVGTVTKGIGYDGAICGACARNIHEAIKNFIEAQNGKIN